MQLSMRGGFGLGATGWLLVSALGSGVAEARGPSGIYSLGAARDNPNTPFDERLAAIRNYNFVSGFTLRVFWNDIETAQGVYDFSVIDRAIEQVSAAGKRLSLEILTGEEPAYVVAGASATYLDHRGGTNPVPWDNFLKQRHAALISALGSHAVSGTPLRDNATLVSIDATPAGTNFGIRDLNSGIRNHPDYTGQKFVDAIVDGVAVTAQQFPRDTNFLAFFAFDDVAPGPRVDAQIIDRLAPLYNATGQPQLAFFIENLSDLGPVPQATGVGTGNNLQTWVSRGGTTMAQALDSWIAHTPDRDAQLASLNPATGIALAANNYGTRFFELYVTDLDAAAAGSVDATGRSIQGDLQYWNTRLTAVPEPGVAGCALLAVAAALIRPNARSRRRHRDSTQSRPHRCAD